MEGHTSERMMDRQESLKTDTSIRCYVLKILSMQVLAGAIGCCVGLRKSPIVYQLGQSANAM